MSDFELERILHKKLKELIKESNISLLKTKMINKPIHLSAKNFEEVIQRNELVLVDFWADWCYPCKMIEPIIEELAKKYPNIKFAKVNVDEEIEIAQRFGIISIPTLILFKKGKPIETLIGVRSKYEIEKVIKSYYNFK